MKQDLDLALRLTLVASRREAAPRSLVELAGLAFDGGATALQLREKDCGDRVFYQQALELRRLCRDRGKLFIINDRLDLALAVEADGLHLGQTDLPAEAAARLMPKSMVLGVSVRSEAEARAALAAGADYLGVGAVFPTGSKAEAAVIDRDDLKAVLALNAPSVAIGGLTAANAAEAWSLGFTGLAVISALTGATDPAQAAAALLSAGPG